MEFKALKTRINVITLFLLIFYMPITLAVDIEDTSKDDEEDIPAIQIPINKDGDMFTIEHITIPKVVGGISVDGKLDDPAWRAARKLSINYEMWPTQFGKPPEKTEAMIFRARKTLYVAFRAYDSNPGKIRSELRLHDAIKFDDYVSIAIDTTGTRTSRYELRVNPMGIKSDLVYSSVNDSYLYDWNPDWDAVSTIDDHGYTVEMAIPLQSLSFPELEPGTKATIMVKRHYPRSVRHTFANFYRLTVKPQEKEHVTSLKITPALAYSDIQERDPLAEDDRWFREESPFQPGTDIKWQINPTSNLFVTINPDFSDIEVDLAKQSINNPFLIFQPEQRPFFQESLDTYETHLKLVYTRTITDPVAAIKYSRREADRAYSYFIAKDDKTAFIIPGNLSSDRDQFERSSYSGGLRYRWDRQSGNALGLLGTIRDAEGYHNYLIAGDALWSLGIKTSIRAQLAYSDTRYAQELNDSFCNTDDCSEPQPQPCLPDNCGPDELFLRTQKQGSFDGHSLRATFKHDGRNWFSNAYYLDVSDGFRADMGYMPLVDMRHLSATYGHNWYFKTLETDEGESRVRFYGAGTYRETQKHEKLIEGIDLWLEYRGSYQTLLRPGIRRHRRVAKRLAQDTLDIEGNAPRFTEFYWQWYTETIPNSALKLNLDGRYGDKIDVKNYRLGTLKEVTPQIQWNLTEHFQLLISHKYSTLSIDKGTVYKENYSTLRATYQTTQKDVLNVVFIYDKTESNPTLYLFDDVDKKEIDTTFQFIYKRQLTPKTTLSTGYIGGTEQNNELTDHTLVERTAFFKILHTFEF